MKALLVLCAIGGCLVALSSCGGGTHDAILATYTRSADDLAALTMRAGETLDLQLQENGTTGFTWRAWWDPPAALELADGFFIPDQPIRPGSGGVRHFVFRAVQPGDVTLTVQYGRWWEGGERMDPQTLPISVLP